MTAGGEIEGRVDPEQARRVVDELVRRGADSIAVCLLNSYADHDNEDAVGAVCAAAGIPVSLSAAWRRSTASTSAGARRSSTAT